MVKVNILFFLFITSILPAFGGEMLRPVNICDTPVREPSGLAYSYAENCFLTVSDEIPAIYRLNLKGKVLGVIKVDASDLEGIAVSDDGTIFVVDEASREVISIDPEGNEILRFDIAVKSSGNNGPEGICVDTDSHLLYILNEKKPGLVLVYDFKGNKQGEYPLCFASDYSGISYDRRTKLFSIVSDEERSLYIWHPERGVSEKYTLDVDSPEGVVTGSNGEIYIISDSDEALYTFETGEK